MSLTSFRFGPAKKVQFEPRMYRSERLDPSGKPTAVYIFKYRSQSKYFSPRIDLALTS